MIRNILVSLFVVSSTFIAGCGKEDNSRIVGQSDELPKAIAAQHRDDAFGRALTLSDSELGTFAYITDGPVPGKITRLDFTPAPGSDEPPFSMTIEDDRLSFLSEDGVTFEIERAADDFLIYLADRDARQEFRSTLSTIVALADSEAKASTELFAPHVPDRAGQFHAWTEYPPAAVEPSNPEPFSPKNGTGELGIEFIPTGPCGVPSTGSSFARFEVDTVLEPNIASPFRQSGRIPLGFSSTSQAWLGAIDRSSLATVADVAIAGTTEALYDLLVSEIQGQLLTQAGIAVVTLIVPGAGLPLSLYIALEAAERMIVIASTAKTIYDQREWVNYVITQGTSSDRTAPFFIQGQYRSQSLSLDSERRLVDADSVSQVTLLAASETAAQLPFVERLVLSTNAPVARQGYTARAELSCDDAPGLRLRLGVVGTDGFRRNNEFQIFPGAVYLLAVPGAASDVQDIITAQIVDPAGDVLGTQSVTLRFQ